MVITTGRRGVNSRVNDIPGSFKKQQALPTSKQKTYENQ